MIKTLTINKYNDPGHGWYALPLEIIKKLNIDLTMCETVICNRKASVIFFEEDCAFTPIYNQLIAKGIDLKVKSFHGNKQSKVRNYPVVDVPYLKRFKNF